MKFGVQYARVFFFFLVPRHVMQPILECAHANVCLPQSEAVAAAAAMPVPSLAFAN